MDSSSSVLYVAAGLPALISTGITFVYFFLRACRYLFDAISHQTKGRVATATSGSGKPEHSSIMEKKAIQKFMNKNSGAIQNIMAEGPKDPQGPFLYQEGGKTYSSLPVGMLQNIKESPLFEKMKKDCQAKGIEIPQTIMVRTQ